MSLLFKSYSSKEILFIDHGDSLNCDEMNSLKDSQMCPSPLRTGIINWINNSEKGKCSCSNSNFPSEQIIRAKGAELISDLDI